MKMLVIENLSIAVTQPNSCKDEWPYDEVKNNHENHDNAVRNHKKSTTKGDEQHSWRGTSAMERRSGRLERRKRGECVVGPYRQSWCDAGWPASRPRRTSPEPAGQRDTPLGLLQALTDRGADWQGRRLTFSCCVQLPLLLRGMVTSTLARSRVMAGVTSTRLARPSCITTAATSAFWATSQAWSTSHQPRRDKTQGSFSLSQTVKSKLSLWSCFLFLALFLFALISCCNYANFPKA